MLRRTDEIEPPAAEPKQPLEYDRSPPVTRRQFRWLIVLTLINTVLLGWFVVGPQSTQFLQQQWERWKMKRVWREAGKAREALQQQCLDFTFAPDTIIYDEEPDSAQRLVADRAGYRPVTIDSASTFPANAGYVPPAVVDQNPMCWSKLATTGGLNGQTTSHQLPLLFLGERTSPSGMRRFVVVQLDARQRVQTRPENVSVEVYRWIGAFAYDRTPSQTKLTNDFSMQFLTTPPPTYVREKGQWRLRERSSMTLLAGQRDPDDASHFMIPYRLDGSDGMIDGWLTDNGLLLKPRAGEPAATYDGRRAWNLSKNGR